MTEQQHPITPPPQLRQLWAQQAQRMDPHDPVAWQEHLAIKAAHWGADQELEACAEWLEKGPYQFSSDLTSLLRATRRPKPPSRADAALKALEGLSLPEEAWTAVSFALERLQELEGKQ